MAIRFIIGRAGSGKTHNCIEAVRQRLRHDPVDGPPLLFLVPEQAAFQVEQALLDPVDVPVAHRATVLSFNRLALKVLESVGSPPRTILSESARLMVLRHLVRSHASVLKYYRRTDRLTGWIERLATVMTELIQEAIEPANLELPPYQDPATGNPGRDAKLHDLRLLYAAYLAFLGTDRLDSSQQLQLARQALPQCSWLAGAELWVDGFASLSRQERLTLLNLAGHCSHVEITMLLDPALARPTQISTVHAPTGRLFRKIHRTYQELHRAFLDAGLRMEDPLILDAAPRFTRNSALAVLERTYFSRELDDNPPAVGGNPRSTAPRPWDRNDHASSKTTDRHEALTENHEGHSPLSLGFARHDTIVLAALPTRRLEVEFAVATVHNWIHNDAVWHYRDIAIIVRDADDYHDLLGEALTARGIPFFVDRRRSISHHPLVELVRAAAAMISDDLSLDSVRRALKTGLLPMEPCAADVLENALLASGIAGRAAWHGGGWPVPGDDARAGKRDDEQLARIQEKSGRIEQARQAFLIAIAPLLDLAFGLTPLTGTVWARALQGWLSKLEIGARLRSWSADAESEGDTELAAEHQQVFRDVVDFLDDFSAAFGDTTLSAREFVEVMDQGLSGLTLGLAPPMIDQVLIGSIERSRHPSVRGAIILGFNDGVFPKLIVEDSLLNDDDRDELQQAGVPIGLSSRQRLLDEALLAYIALTRASDRLVVTYAESDSQGRTMRPSPYCRTLSMTCPLMPRLVLEDPVRTRDTWDILSRRDLGRRLVMEFRNRPQLTADDLEVRGRWNELYEAAQSPDSRYHDGTWPLSSLSGLAEARLSPDSLQRWHRGTLRTSVSQLETFAACPFQHFAGHTLDLRERELSALAPVDSGRIQHAVLEELFSAIVRQNSTFGNWEEADVRRALNESWSRAAVRMGGELSPASSRDDFNLRSAANQLTRVATALCRISRAGNFRPRSLELPFGFDQPGSLPALEIDTPAGRRVQLRGYIDRVDIAEFGGQRLGVVIDYKTTADKRLRMDMVYHGLALQLPAYLLVLAEHGAVLIEHAVQPIAGVFVSLAPRYQIVPHPLDAAESRSANLPGTYRPRGLFREDGIQAIDHTSTSGWSDLFSIFRKKDGTLGQIDNSDAAESEGFELLLRHTRWKLGQLADAILDGDIAVNPFRIGTQSPCTWCPMKSVCRFEIGISKTRYLSALTRSQVFERLHGIHDAPSRPNRVE